MVKCPCIHIGNNVIGSGNTCFIVAEISGNHHQHYREALELIEIAAEAGADAVKLQTYTPDTLTIDSDKPWFIVESENTPDAWKGHKLYDLYKTAYTPWDWQPKLAKVANERGIILFSTPFDETAVDFLEKEIDPPVYKIASYETNHIPLLKKIAKTGKPVILSAGFANVADIKLALKTLNDNGADQVALLHCVSTYSSEPNLDDINLRTIVDMTKRFNVVGGFSDNNGGIEIPIIAAALGASIIEKHVILDRSTGGPDASFSIEPQELAKLVGRIRENETKDSSDILVTPFAKRVIGKVKYGPENKAEKYNGKRFSQSVFAVSNIEKGETLTKANIRCIRPGDGLAPRYFEEVLGKVAASNIERGTPLSWKLVVK